MQGGCYEKETGKSQWGGSPFSVSKSIQAKPNFALRYRNRITRLTHIAHIISYLHELMGELRTDYGLEREIQAIKWIDINLCPVRYKHKPFNRLSLQEITLVRLCG